MKRIFLDTNFIIDFLLREEYKPACIDLLAKGKENGYRFYISFLSVANFAYIARKSPRQERDEYISNICNLFSVVSNTALQLNRAIAMDAADFEDALQYQSAIEARCDCIITRNQKDFSFSEIPVLSATEYLSTYF
jgi:toxin-antitoxin system, toxin component, PIN family